jgi:hypothetical protein
LEDARVQRRFWIAVVVVSLARIVPAWGDGVQQANPTTLQPVPEAAVLARAEKAVAEFFPRPAGSVPVEQRQARARRMLEQALDTRDDAALRYVLLREAADVAALANDPACALKAVVALRQGYSIEYGTVLLATMSSASSAATTPAAATGVATTCLPCVDELLMAEQVEAAQRLANVAHAAAERSQNVPLLARAKDKAREVQAALADAPRLAEARAALKQTADDPEANLVIGRHLCLSRGDWKAGAPHLAKCADAMLAPAARLDALAGGDSARAIDAANAWWELSLTQQGLARKQMQSRSVYWYRVVAAGPTTGFNRTRAESRIAQVDGEQMRELNLAAGLVAELFKGGDFATRVKQRVDANIDFDWDDGQPDPAAPKDNFSIRWSGVLRCTAGGKYAFNVNANAGCRIWVDNKVVFENFKITKLKGEPFELALSEGLHAIRVEYRETTGKAKMRLLWTPPGATKEEAVPAGAFYHEVR